MINILADYIMSITIIDMSTLDYERCNEELSKFRWREIDYIRLEESKLFSIYENHTLVGFTHVILMDNYVEQYSLIFKERASSNTTKYIFSKN